MGAQDLPQSLAELKENTILLHSNQPHVSCCTDAPDAAFDDLVAVAISADLEDVPSFSIRGYVAAVREINITKCWPFSRQLLEQYIREDRRPLLPDLVPCATMVPVCKEYYAATAMVSSVADACIPDDGRQLQVQIDLSKNEQKTDCGGVSKEPDKTQIDQPGCVTGLSVSQVHNSTNAEVPKPSIASRPIPDSIFISKREAPRSIRELRKTIMQGCQCCRSGEPSCISVDPAYSNLSHAVQGVQPIDSSRGYSSLLGLHAGSSGVAVVNLCNHDIAGVSSLTRDDIRLVEASDTHRVDSVTHNSRESEVDKDFNSSRNGKGNVLSIAESETCEKAGSGENAPGRGEGFQSTGSEVLLSNFHELHQSPGSLNISKSFDSGQCSDMTTQHKPFEPVQCTDAVAQQKCPVCLAFQCSSNTALNAHIDQCLAACSEAEKTKSKLYKAKSRKKRSIAELFLIAPPCQLADNTCAREPAFKHDEKTKSMPGYNRHRRVDMLMLQAKTLKLLHWRKSRRQTQHGAYKRTAYQGRIQHIKARSESSSSIDWKTAVLRKPGRKRRNIKYVSAAATGPAKVAASGQKIRTKGRKAGLHSSNKQAEPPCLPPPSIMSKKACRQARKEQRTTMPISNSAEQQHAASHASHASHVTPCDTVGVALSSHETPHGLPQGDILSDKVGQIMTNSSTAQMDPHVGSVIYNVHTVLAENSSKQDTADIFRNSSTKQMPLRLNLIQKNSRSLCSADGVEESSICESRLPVIENPWHVRNNEPSSTYISCQSNRSSDLEPLYYRMTTIGMPGQADTSALSCMQNQPPGFRAQDLDLRKKNHQDVPQKHAFPFVPGASAKDHSLPRGHNGKFPFLLEQEERAQGMSNIEKSYLGPLLGSGMRPWFGGSRQRPDISEACIINQNQDIFRREETLLQSAGRHLDPFSAGGNLYHSNKGCLGPLLSKEHSAVQYPSVQTGPNNDTMQGQSLHTRLPPWMQAAIRDQITAPFSTMGSNENPSQSSFSGVATFTNRESSMLNVVEKPVLRLMGKTMVVTPEQPLDQAVTTRELDEHTKYIDFLQQETLGTWKEWNVHQQDDTDWQTGPQNCARPEARSAPELRDFFVTAPTANQMSRYISSDLRYDSVNHITGPGPKGKSVRAYELLSQRGTSQYTTMHPNAQAKWEYKNIKGTAAFQPNHSGRMLNPCCFHADQRHHNFQSILPQTDMTTRTHHKTLQSLPNLVFNDHKMRKPYLLSEKRNEKLHNQPAHVIVIDDDDTTLIPRQDSNDVRPPLGLSVSAAEQAQQKPDWLNRNSTSVDLMPGNCSPTPQISRSKRFLPIIYAVDDFADSAFTSVRRTEQPTANELTIEAKKSGTDFNLKRRISFSEEVWRPPKQTKTSEKVFHTELGVTRSIAPQSVGKGTPCEKKHPYIQALRAALEYMQGKKSSANKQQFAKPLLNHDMQCQHSSDLCQLVPYTADLGHVLLAARKEHALDKVEICSMNMNPAEVDGQEDASSFVPMPCGDISKTPNVIQAREDIECCMLPLPRPALVQDAWLPTERMQESSSCWGQVTMSFKEHRLVSDAALKLPTRYDDNTARMPGSTNSLAALMAYSTRAGGKREYTAMSSSSERTPRNQRASHQLQA